jgi:uncharacterized protein YgfB (UPF0149 family)
MTHAELQASFARMNITVDAAEAHGRLCGTLCVREAYGAKEWLLELADGHEVATAPEPALDRLPGEAREFLESDEFEFAPLLPEDDAPLAERVAALAAWCEGFLFGIGSGASGADIAKTEDVGELLGDFADIAHAELEPGRSDAAGEGDFMELFEFVRAGAQLAYDELAGARAHAAG